MPHDAEGIDPDALEAELARDPRPAFLYLLPTFQNPTGRTISTSSAAAGCSSWPSPTTC